MSAGHCSLGSSCGYCHLTHEVVAAHLDKRNRDSLRQLTQVERIQLMIPMLRQRAAERGFAAEAEEVLSILDAMCEGVPSNAGRGGRQGGQGGQGGKKAKDAFSSGKARTDRLYTSMNTMNFTALLAIAVPGARTPADGEATAQDSNAAAVEAIRKALGSLSAKVALKSL